MAPVRVEDRHDGLCDFAGDPVLGGRCGDYLHSPGIMFCQVKKAGANFMMEPNRLTVEAILVRASPSTSQAPGDWKIEDQRQVWRDGVAREAVE